MIKTGENNPHELQNMGPAAPLHLQHFFPIRLQAIQVSSERVKFLLSQKFVQIIFGILLALQTLVQNFGYSISHPPCAGSHLLNASTNSLRKETSVGASTETMKTKPQVAVFFQHSWRQNLWVMECSSKFYPEKPH